MKFRMLVLALFVAIAAHADEITLRAIASGLPRPVAIANCGDDRLFVTLKGGRVMIVRNGSVLPQPFLDITGLVSTGEEQGLLSVAFDPLFAVNGFFYVDYTDVKGNTVIARYRVSAADPDRADTTSAVNVLTIAQPYANHNGGQLQFGTDGLLYIGMGDGGSEGDPQNRGQSLDTLLGKLLRIDVRNLPYSVPAGNPFVGRSGVKPEIWAYGLRNPWRFSFDRATGDLLIADVGQDSWEEVDFQPAASSGGQNYGWRRMEATHCFDPPSNCQDGSLTLPVLEYSHAVGCAISGGYVYRGTRWPRLNGTYVYGDYCSGTIWGARQMADGTWTSRTLASTRFVITTFGEDAAGEIYVADFNSGTIYAIADAVPQPPRRRAARR